MYDGIDLNQITITNRFGYAILEDQHSGRSLVCEPTTAGPDIIAFVIVERCENREDALMMTMALNDMGVQPTDWRQPPPEQQPEPAQIEATPDDEDARIIRKFNDDSGVPLQGEVV